MRNGRNRRRWKRWRRNKRRVSKGGERKWEEKESVMRNWMRRNEEEEGIKTERKR